MTSLFLLSSSSYLIPVFAVLVGWLFLKEAIEPASILAMGLILTGVYLANRSTLRRAKD